MIIAMCCYAPAGCIHECTVSPHEFGEHQSTKNTFTEPRTREQAGRSSGHRRALLHLGKMNYDAARHIEEAFLKACD